MTRGLHRAPSRLSRALDGWQARPFTVRLIIGAIVVVLAAGLLHAFIDANHHDQPTPPTTTGISASPTSMPRAVR